MEVDQDHNLILAGLEDCVLDIGVHNVHNLSPGRNETQTIGVRLEIALRLAAGKDRTHGKVRKSRNALVLGPNKLLLLDEIRLLQLAQLTLAFTLSKLLDLAEGLGQALAVQTAKGHFANERRVRRILLDQLQRVGRGLLAKGHARSVKVDAQICSRVGFGKYNVLDGTDVERDRVAADGEDDALIRHIHLDLVRQDIIGIVLRPAISEKLFGLFRLLVTVLALALGPSKFAQPLLVPAGHQLDLLPLTNSGTLNNILHCLSILGQTLGLALPRDDIVRLLGNLPCKGGIIVLVVVRSRRSLALIVVHSVRDIRGTLGMLGHDLASVLGHGNHICHNQGIRIQILDLVVHEGGQDSD